MRFNNGNERRKLNAEWEHLRRQYREAGMSEEAIQAMYEFDLDALNSERAYTANTLLLTEGDKSSEEELSRIKFEEANPVQDSYHETKSRFAWIGEIQDERLSDGLESLSEEDLWILTLYFVDGYKMDEISKIYNVSQPYISKWIAKITKFLKNF